MDQMVVVHNLNSIIRRERLDENYLGMKKVHLSLNMSILKEGRKNSRKDVKVNLGLLQIIELWKDWNPDKNYLGMIKMQQIQSQQRILEEIMKGVCWKRKIGQKIDEYSRETIKISWVEQMRNYSEKKCKENFGKPKSM